MTLSALAGHDQNKWWSKLNRGNDWCIVKMSLTDLYYCITHFVTMFVVGLMQSYAVDYHQEELLRVLREDDETDHYSITIK